VLFEAGNAVEVGYRPQSENEMIVGKLVKMRSIDAVRDVDALVAEIDRFHFPGEKIRSPQHLSERVDDSRNIEIAGGHFVEHRSEEEEVLAINQGDFDV
jgi:hypothetical protein